MYQNTDQQDLPQGGNSAFLRRAYNQGMTDANEKLLLKQPQDLSTHFENIKLEMRAQGAADRVRIFAGENSTKFQHWLSDMNRLRTQLSADDTRSRVLALQTLTGHAADYCIRLIENEPEISWKDLRDKLSDRYNDLADIQYARQMLRRITQLSGESVQNYFEKMIKAAKSAYGNEDMNERLIQQELTEIFIDGLNDDYLVRRLIKLKPNTVEKALQLAADEQQTQKSFDLRRGTGATTEQEPMEVNICTAPFVESFQD